MTDQDPPIFGSQEGAGANNSGGDSYWTQRGREFDQRRNAAAAVQDVVIVNGKPWQPDRRAADASKSGPVVAPAKPAEAAPAPAPTGNQDAPVPMSELAELPEGMKWFDADTALASLKSACPAGAELVQQWGADGAVNVRMSQAVTGALLSGLSAEGVRHIQAALNGLTGPDFARVHNNLAGYGRQTSGKPATTKPKGQTMAEYQFNGTRPELEAKYQDLTDEMHTMYARGDRTKAQRLMNERNALSQVLFPGGGPK